MMWNRGKIRTVMLAAGVCLMTGCAGDIQEESSVAVLQPQPLAESPAAAESTPAPTPSEESPAEESPSPEAESDLVTITISAAGDVTLGTHQDQDYWNSFRQAYDQAEDESYFFANVYDIFSTDDMTLVNLEGPLTLAEEAREGQIYSIKGDPEYVNILTAGSVEAVSMGNNHTLDYQQQGREDTIRAVEEAGVVYACEKTVGMYEVKGINIGMISVNEVSQGYLVEDTIQKGIAELQEQGADLILVSCHWGVEREYYPEDYQKILGEKCIEWGADLVIGHHPHVLQGIDEYKGKFILYSLGNFCFGANRNPPDKDTMIFQQTFTFIDGEKQEDQEIRVIPCSVSSVSERNNFQPTPAEGEEKARILSRINEFSLEFGVQFDEDGNMQE
ncbi:MAG: CapA family protein [Blautia sp.]|nr:CapA family protein [Blautia sp.]